MVCHISAPSSSFCSLRPFVRRQDEKKQADATTDSCNDEGFAKAMERFILGAYHRQIRLYHRRVIEVALEYPEACAREPSIDSRCRSFHLEN